MNLFSQINSDFSIEIPYNNTGTTYGYGDNFMAFGADENWDCGYDVIYEFTAQNNGIVSLELNMIYPSTTYVWPNVSIFSSLDDITSVDDLIIQDGFIVSNFVSFDFQVLQNNNYYIIIDGETYCNLFSIRYFNFNLNLSIEVSGCTDIDACNFNALATDDDGLCEYANDPCESCDGGIVVLNDSDNDGICNDDEVSGCTDATACNFNSSATDDDGSCELPDGCTDNSACNYDNSATCDDGSCFYNSLTVDECEVVYCNSESGEQSNSSSTTPLQYLTIPISESGTLNELYYNINWHNQGWIGGGVPGPYSNITIKLYDNNDQELQVLELLYDDDPLGNPTYINFESTDSYDIDVQSGYYISIQALVSAPAWVSYINLANISFTVEINVSPSQITPN